MKALELTFVNSSSNSKSIEFSIEGGIAYTLHHDRYQYQSAQMIIGRESLTVKGDLVNAPAMKYLNAKNKFDKLQQEYQTWKSPVLKSFFESYGVSDNTLFEDIYPTRVYDFDYKKLQGESARLLACKKDSNDSIMLKINTGVKPGYFLPNIKCDGVTIVGSYTYKEFKSTGFCSLYCIENNSTLVIPITVFGASRSGNFHALLINYKDGSIRVTEKDIVNNDTSFTLDDVMNSDVYEVDELIEEGLSFEDIFKEELYKLNSTPEKENREKDYQKILDNL